jgi:hypothetical protein
VCMLSCVKEGARLRNGDGGEAVELKDRMNGCSMTGCQLDCCTAHKVEEQAECCPLLCVCLFTFVLPCGIAAWSIPHEETQSKTTSGPHSPKPLHNTLSTPPPTIPQHITGPAPTPPP